jgi:hypothetical protein
LRRARGRADVEFIAENGGGPGRAAEEEQVREPSYSVRLKVSVAEGAKLAVLAIPGSCLMASTSLEPDFPAPIGQLPKAFSIQSLNRGRVFRRIRRHLLVNDVFLPLAFMGLCGFADLRFFLGSDFALDGFADGQRYEGRRDEWVWLRRTD